MRNIAYRFVTASRPRASSISDRAGFFPTGSAQASPICSAPPTEFFTARQASNSSGPSPESRFHFALTTRSTCSDSTAWFLCLKSPSCARAQSLRRFRLGTRLAVLSLFSGTTPGCLFRTAHAVLHSLHHETRQIVERSLAHHRTLLHPQG